MPSRLALPLALLCFAAAPLAAQAQPWIAIGFGTTGPSAEVGVRTPRVGVRVGSSFLNWSYNQRISGQSYEADFRFKGRHAVVDFYPSAGGSFHLSGGVSGPPLHVRGTGRETLNHNYIINSHVYAASAVGALVADFFWPDLSPYVGLGWSGGMAGERIKFTFDIGTTIGGPDVTLVATNATEGSALAADVAAERDQIQHEVDFAKVFPILSVGMKVRL